MQGAVMTVAIAQFAPKLGDVSFNLARHMEYIGQATAKGAHLIVFPELGLTGYQLQDLTLDVAKRLDDEEIQQLIRASEQIDIAFSFVEECPEHFFYVSSVYASKGQVVHIHRKVYLPTYGMFDEQRYVGAGDVIKSFPTQFDRKFGIMICEDAWHVSVPYLLTMHGASTLIVPASSPARNVMDQNDFGSHAFWRQLLQMYAQLFGVSIIFANRVGYEDGVHFYGGSGLVTPDGHWAAEAPMGEETLLFAQVDERDVRRARYTTPLLRDERPDLVLRHLENLGTK